ncbi:MAG: hypothetical protein QXP04_01220 [Candidatus Nanoarchaeia archaeon]|nr:hypothetical protein [Candidatus Jingweiarchaeum tengchongense]
MTKLLGFYTDERGKKRPITSRSMERKTTLSNIDFEYAVSGTEEDAPRELKKFVSERFGDEPLESYLIKNIRGENVAALVDGKEHIYFFEKLKHFNEEGNLELLWKIVRIDQRQTRKENVVKVEDMSRFPVRQIIFHLKPTKVQEDFFMKLDVERGVKNLGKKFSTTPPVEGIKWKYGTRPVRVSSMISAKKIAKTLSTEHGGAEIYHLPDKTYVVNTRGYYYYIGA